MKRPWWQLALLISISTGVNISRNFILPQSVLAQSNSSQAEANRLLIFGLAEWKRGNFQGALEPLQTALSLFKANGNRASEASTLRSLGLAKERLGAYKQTIEYHQQALKIYKELRDRDGEALTDNLLAGVEVLRGNYKQAIDYFNESEKIYKEIGNRAGEASSLHGLSELYTVLGQYQSAIEYNEKSLEIYQKIGNLSGEGAALSGLGSIYGNRGFTLAIPNPEDLNKALKYYKRALEINRKLGNRQEESYNLNNLGLIQSLLGQEQEAIKTFEQALELKRKLGDWVGESSTLGNLGYAHSNLGEYPKAIKYHQQALEISKKVGKKSEQIANLSNLGGIYNFLQQPAEAEKYFQQAIVISDDLRTNLNDKDKISLLERQLFAYKALSFVQQIQGKSAESLVSSERGRTRAFQELLAQKQNFAKPTTPNFAEIQAIARREKLTIVEYNIMLKAQKKYDSRKQDELFIYVISPDGKLTVRVQPLSESDFLEKLVNENIEDINKDPNQNTNRGSITKPLFRVGQDVRVKSDQPNNPSRKIVKIAGNKVEVTSLSNNTDTDSVTIDQIIPLDQPKNTDYPKLKDLHRLLIKPIVDLLPTNPNSPVIFIPDKALFKVPFVALQDETGKYLIDKHTVLTAPSLGVLVQTSKIKPQGNKALVVGNPTMPKPREAYQESQLQPLSFSENEANEVAKLYQTKVLIGSEATESKIRPLLSQYPVIHLSTHGIFNPNNVGESAIVLAKDGKNDGYLTVNKILDLKMNADLVVLSACDTGRGDIKGDGVVGLSRAFMTAGTRSLIVSLWPVNDQSTSELMQEFYRQWQPRNKSKAEALRNAMLKVKQNYPSPYHWAGMNLIGEIN